MTAVRHLRTALDTDGLRQPIAAGSRNEHKGEGAMSIESSADLDAMRVVGRITRLTLDALERRVRPGITTAALDAVAAALFATHGARSAPALEYGFPGTVLISVNDEVVHGIPGARTLARGDVVKLDVTVEKDGYVADAARTVLVGSGTETARRLIACSRAAFRAALTVARAGTRVNEIGRAVEQEVRRHGFSVVHGLSGHGVGRAIHEEPSVPNWYDPWQRDVLTDGLVLTIEPLISAGSSRAVTDRDGWTVRTADGSLAAHHEHTLVITAQQPLILTAA
jgi:methionyl aminopeptidase